MSAQSLTSQDQISRAVSDHLRSQPIVDMHTHTFPPAFGTPVPNAGGAVDSGGLMLWGIDELLSYHYLVAEVFRVAPASTLPYEEFWKMTAQEKGDYIWRRLFVEHSPISEACRGVVTTLTQFGLDPNVDSLDQIRRWYSEQQPDAFVDRVMELANVERITMTNEVFDANERRRWLSNPDALRDPRFDAVLRIDPLLLDWPAAAQVLREGGYQAAAEPDAGSLEETRRFLRDWAGRMRAIYLAVSLPPSWRYPEDGPGRLVLEQAVLPVCRELNLPFAMMIGSRRGVNPGLRGAGDMGGYSDIWSVTNLLAAHPDNRFLVTMLSRENQQELCVAARKFGNLLIFGCWWFLNNPSLVEEVTRLRLELLGTSFIPQHSDARVLDQVPYKWRHSREVIGRVLAEKYDDLRRSGWRVTEQQIERDIRLLLRDNFRNFLSG